MKNFLFGFIATVLFSFSGLANNQIESNESNSTKQLTSTIEIRLSTIDDIDCCEVRYCWLEGTTKVCTPWQEVPCDKGLMPEGQQCPTIALN